MGTAVAPRGINLPRIAVVDDDPTLLELMTDIVRERGWEMLPVKDDATITAVAGQEALVAVLVEIHPAVRDARWELLHRLKADPATSSIPLILWSSDTRMFQDHQEWLDAHQVLMLARPFELTDLYAHLDLLDSQTSTVMRDAG
jgi:CheY-like chemotaxis protein